MAYQSVTLTGTYKRVDGTANSGKVYITPSSAPILDATGDVVIAGSVAVTLDANGHFSVTLPATDDATLNPTGFGYTVLAGLRTGTLPEVSFALPTSPSTVDMADVTSVDPSTFTPGATYLVAANDLSDVASAATARTNLGLGTAATHAHGDYATAAQGATADAAVQPAGLATTLATAAALPANAGTRTNPYDAGLNVYNFKPSNTRRMRAGLAKAMAGGLTEWVVLGDSGPAGCTNGATLTYDRLNAWPIAMRDELARHGIPKGGTGLVRIRDNSRSDARWAFNGSWVHTFLTSSYIAGAGDATMTSDLGGDRVSVLYYDLGTGQGTFTVSVNGAGSGAGFTTITETNPAGWKIVTLSPGTLSAGATVKVTRTTGTMMIGGAQVWSTSGGLVVHNLSQSGATATGTGNAAWVDNTTGLGLPYTNPVTNPSTTGAVTPDAVFLSLLGNDLQLSKTPAQITAALTTIRDRYPSSDCVLVAPAPVNPTLVPLATWDAGITALFDLADTLDVPLVDHRARLGDYATFATALGLSVDGQGHLIAGASASLGRNLGMVFAS